MACFAVYVYKRCIFVLLLTPKGIKHNHNGKMNRQIKFRFYDKALSKMVYRTILPYDNEHPEIVVMQFTGREDADINGAEVYEGDIIENCDTKALQVVYWNEDEAAWYCRYVEDENRIVSLSDSLGNLNKVVGNIFENADLLQVAS